MEGYLNVTGISVRREMMDSHVVSMHMQENMWLIVSPFYTTLILSLNYIRQTSSPIPFRIQFSVVTINSSSLLLFGGRTVNNVASNDLWQFSLIQRIWKKVKMIESAVSLPSPRYGHTAAVIGVDMFVFGGYNNNGSIIRAYEYKDLWRYNMINHSWSILVPTNNLLFNSVHYYLCFYAATAQSGMLWIAAKCPSLAIKRSHNVQFELWMFIVHLRTWNFVALQTIEYLPYNYFYSSLYFWQRYLLSLEHSSLTYLKAGCPEGLGSSNISSVPCDVCKVGFYSDVKTNECSKCPNGTTTREERSSRTTDCNVCITGYCLHGRCLVVSNRLTQVPVCTCTIGFTGSHCQDPTYYYIGLGVILVIGIIALLVIVLQQTR